jgi:hypothetical protein
VGGDAAADLMRKVAGLAAVAALLAAYLLFGDRRPGAGDGGPGGHARLVDAFERAAVRRITIRRAEGAAFSLVRQPPGKEPTWRESPGGEAADEAAVDDLLNAIDLAETTRTADVGADAAGLAPPRVALELDEPRGAVTIELGRLDASGQGVFARAGGTTAIRVAPRRLAELADREPSAFRDRRLVPWSAEAITALSWREAVGNRVERRLRLIAGRWQNADNQRVSGERVAESLHRLLGLRVVRYEPPEPAPEAPSQITVQAAGGATMRLSFPGGGCAGQPGLRVEREGPSVVDGACLAPDALGDLWRSLEAASAPDLRLVSSPPDTVTRVEIAGDAGDTGAPGHTGAAGQNRQLVLARQPGGAWRFEAPKVTYAADPRLIGDWLAALRSVEVRPAPVAMKGHVGVRRLTVDGGTRETVALSPGDPGYALLDPDPLRFRDRAVLDFAHFDARELERSAGGQSVELTSADGDSWRVVAPAGAAADRTSAARVVGALGNLRVETYLPAQKVPPGPPEVSLAIAIQPPGEAAPIRHTLELYKKKEAPGCTGRLDLDVAFTLAPAACDELRLGLLN